jgi:ankyrin repeat protein
MRASRYLLTGILALAAVANGADVNELLPDGTSQLLLAVHRLDHDKVQQLLKQGANPNLRNDLGATPLNEAIELLDEVMVTALLANGADPNLGNLDDETPLMLAARAGNLPMVEQLVSAGANVNAREKQRSQTALMWAAGAGSAPVTAFLIQHKAEVDIRSAEYDWGNQITSEPRAQYRPSGGFTPLLIAARSGCLECARLLLAAGADINRPTPDGVTPLMIAIDNSHYDVAGFLLGQGANPHLSDWWGRTALYIAVDMHTGGSGGTGARAPSNIPGVGPADGPPPTALGALRVAQQLLEAGVNPNTQLDMHRPGRGGNLGRFTDDLLTTGCTPLLRAAISEDRDMVQLLLAHGAQADLPNVMGVTPLMAAAGLGTGGGGSGSAGVMPRGDVEGNALAVIQMLLDAGADINARVTDTSGHTAFIARPNSMTDRQGQTAIFGAISNSRIRVLRFLLDHGARLDVKDAAGKTVLDAIAGNAGGRDKEKPVTAEMAQFIKTALGTT